MEKLYLGDCLDVLKTLPENSVDSIVTDPPAGISFMSKGWDSDKGGRDNWIEWMSNIAKECLRVLKPGGHAFVWALPRTTHWTATAWENGGFEPRDVVAHCFGSGFPKSLNIGKAVDKLQGNKREEYVDEDFIKRNPKDNSDGVFESGLKDGIDGAKRTKGTSPFEGWGTALKPAREDWWLMRKPIEKGLTIAENCLKYGTGGINIDESRVGTETMPEQKRGNSVNTDFMSGGITEEHTGRFPANLLHDNSEEVRECFPETKASNYKGGIDKVESKESIFGSSKTRNVIRTTDSGNASRFFKSIIYQSKASKSERNKGMDELEAKPMYKADGSGQSLEIFGSTDGGREDRKNNHPTVKPVELMKYLIKMITPKGGIVLDPFAGSGSTLVAAKENGFGFIGIELTPEYIPIIEARVGVKAETINKRYLADNKILEQEIIYQQEDNEMLNKSIDKRRNRCSCGGRIVKTKSGVLTCEDCFETY